MSKRNYDDFRHSPGVYTTDRNREAQRRQVRALLDNSQQSLLHALKLARGFERQKLGRRQKTAKADRVQGDTARLGAEITALKVDCHDPILYNLLI